MITSIYVALQTQDEADRLAAALNAAGQYHSYWGKGWSNKDLILPTGIYIDETGTWNYVLKSLIDEPNYEVRTLGDVILLLRSESWPVPRFSRGTLIEAAGDIRPITGVILGDSGQIMYMVKGTTHRVDENEITATYERKEVTA